MQEGRKVAWKQRMEGFMSSMRAWLGQERAQTMSANPILLGTRLGPRANDTRPMGALVKDEKGSRAFKQTSRWSDDIENTRERDEYNCNVEEKC